MTALLRRLAAAPPWTVVTERDLSYLKVDDDRVLVVACDSHGGLGPKPYDTVSVDPSVLGRFALRVPLVELIAVGATARLVVDALAVERDPTGEAILAGIRAEAVDAGLDPACITGSTEENVPTVATGLGVTVIGDVSLGDLRVGRARTPSPVVLFGRPMSAPADVFAPDHPDIVDVRSVRRALAHDGVLELLPVGSRGVAAEFDALAHGAGGRAQHDVGWPCAPDQSGGPSTAVLLAVDPNRLDDVIADLSHTGRPTWVIGTIV